MMTDFENFPTGGLSMSPPLRWHHLSGGLLLLQGENRLAMLASPGSPDLLFFSILPNVPVPWLFKQQQGIRVLGRNWFSHAAEMRDPVASHFTIAAPSKDRKCLAHAQIWHWSGVANALVSDSRQVDAMVAARLRAQIAVSMGRLEMLSSAYRTVLRVVTQTSTATEQSATSDKYAAYLASEYRSCLNELYSLRDSALLAMFRFRFRRYDPFTMKKLQALVSSDTGLSAKMAMDSMFDPHGDHLIDEMSLYRSIAQHCLGATNPFVDVYQVRISRGPFGTLPYLIFPLYDDIQRMRLIEQGSSKGVIEPLPRAEAQRFFGLPNPRDALEFCYDCFVRLLHLCEALAGEIAIEPRTLTLTDDDIVEAVLTDAKGNTVRLKRDAESGNLSKC
jgi:hypothetical protein